MIEGETQFAPVCTLRQSTEDKRQILTLSSPSGGFRRLLVTDDGHGVVVADGAVAAFVRPIGPNMIEVAIENDHYHIPAKVKQTRRESQ